MIPFVTEEMLEARIREETDELIKAAAGIDLQDALEQAEDRLLNPYHEMLADLQRGDFTGAGVALRHFLALYFRDKAAELAEVWRDDVEEQEAVKARRG